jgi:hypothetical protein
MAAETLDPVLPRKVRDRAERVLEAADGVRIVALEVALEMSGQALGE